jgi:hypothetical protein
VLALGCKLESSKGEAWSLDTKPDSSSELPLHIGSEVETPHGVESAEPHPDIESRNRIQACNDGISEADLEKKQSEPEPREEIRGKVPPTAYVEQSP